MKKLTTTVDIIEALGGNKAVAAILGADPKAVSNWRYFGIFPANTYVALKRALKKAGYSAPDELWAMKTGATP